MHRNLLIEIDSVIQCRLYLDVRDKTGRRTATHCHARRVRTVSESFEARDPGSRRDTAQARQIGTERR